MTEFQMLLAVQITGMAVLWAVALAAQVFDARGHNSSWRFALAVFATMTAASFTFFGLLHIILRTVQL